MNCVKIKSSNLKKNVIKVKNKCMKRKVIFFQPSFPVGDKLQCIASQSKPRFLVCRYCHYHLIPMYDYWLSKCLIK